MVKVILQKQTAHVNAEGNIGRAPSLMRCARGPAEIAKAFPKPDDVDENTASEGNTPLSWSIGTGASTR